MMKLKLFIIVFLGLIMQGAYGQSHFTISGYVSDAANSEKLSGAGIRILPASEYGTLSNTYGFYSITLNAGQIKLACSFIGFKTDTIRFYLSKDTIINFHLSDISILKPVTIKSTAPLELSSGISHISIPLKELTAIPTLMGEKDIIKAIQLLPGVQTANDGSNGIFVRGGGPDQNLILLDGVPVYNISHLFGFFSVFTPEAIQSVDFYEGGFPARYGGRLSSVLDIRMKEGDMKKLTGEFGVGLLSSRFLLEGPVKKNKSSFIISGRRTYLDVLLKPFIYLAGKTDYSTYMAGYYFQDYTVKFNNIINDKNRLYFSFYGGNDKFYGKYKEKEKNDYDSYNNKTKAGIGWGNITSALRWNSIITPKLFSNFTLSYTRFRYFLNAKNEQTIIDRHNSDNSQSSQYQFGYSSNIRDWAGKADFDYSPNPSHSIKFGLGLIFHRFEPGVSISKNSGDSALTGHPVEIKQGSDPVFSKNFNIYAEDRIAFNGHLEANIGLRAAAYNVKKRNYYSLQPRFAGKYLLGHEWSLKAGYARMFQPLHLLVNSGAGLPTDLWVPATPEVPPENSNQYTLGVAKTFKQQYEFSFETYYKTMNRVIAYKDGANFTNTTTNWQEKVDIGKGRAYGFEVFLQKKTGNTTGWIAYTLGFNRRQFPNLNQGKSFPYKHDRRHDAKLVIIHQFSRHFRLSASWLYASGNTITLPVLKYNSPYNGITYDFPYALFSSSNNQSVGYIPFRNNFRMKAYHRLDLGIDLIKQKKNGVRTWNFSIYNVYSRQNPYFYYYQKEKDGSLQLKQFSLLPIIPSVTYQFQFK